VIADAAGHRPVKATGLLMIYLQAIIDSLPSGPSILVLSVDEVGRKKRDLYGYLRRIARQEHVAVQDRQRAVNREREAWLLSPDR
jgi:hypothetical protein